MIFKKFNLTKEELEKKEELVEKTEESLEKIGKSKSQIEARFTETKKTLESSQKEINEFLKKELLDESDRVRLTRVLQLVERYKPQREVAEPKINKWLSYLETVYRFLPGRRKSKKTIDAENISARSYLLAEKTIASLRTLRHLDFQLKQESGFSEEEILNQERPTEVVAREILDTSLTLEYEKKNWGVERICLDGIQNHLPSDSKGENVWIRCLVDGSWVSLDEARQKKDKIEAVRFIDDGVGFDVRCLALLYSTKVGERESRGQFGEGIKMMAAAALREGLELEMESQNWRAKPIIKEVEIFDTRHQKKQKVEQLAFQVEYLKGEKMIGSRTTFYKPTKAFIDELMQIEKKVLALRDNYRPAFVGSEGEIVDRESGNIFVKGIYVTNKKTLFSYNFEDAETNRDRNVVVSEDLEKRIAKIVGELSDKRLIKTLLKKSILEEDAIESSYIYIEPKHPSVWVEAFYEAFGKDAVLDTGFKIPDVFKEKSIKRIKLPSSVTSLLLRVSVKTDREATPDFWEETIPTSLTLDYGKDIWNEERILLDAIQNHLPHDSGGSIVGLRFKTKDGKWHPYFKLASTKDEEIEAIRIYDNGYGYDSRLLGFFHSTKEGNESAGKFGEGLKMLCVASLRKGIDVTLRSRDWLAKPRVLKQEIDGKEISQLVFDVIHTIKNKDIIDDDKEVYQSSSTTFSNLTPELLKEFREINKKVLALEKTKPVESTSNGDILSLEGGLLYVRELLIPGDHNLLFTYHLPKFEMKSRDRGFIDQKEIASAIAQIWSEVKNREVIKTFLFKANLEAKKSNVKDKLIKAITDSTPVKDKLEFCIDFIPKDKENWKKIFEEVFGKDTAIRDVRSEDFDAMQQNMHVGLTLISFPTAVYRVLQRLGLPTYESRIKEMTDVEVVPEEELTSEEKGVIEILKAIDEYLPNNKSAVIKVFKRKFPDQKVAEGFYNDKEKAVYLLRDILKTLPVAADFYVHEKTHQNTDGASDASKIFRDYLTLTLSRIVLEKLKEVRPDLLKTEE